MLTSTELIINSVLSHWTKHVVVQIGWWLSENLGDINCHPVKRTRLWNGITVYNSQWDLPSTAKHIHTAALARVGRANKTLFSGGHIFHLPGVIFYCSILTFF